MSSGFVTETEAVEARKRRQDEWEKVRTAEQPLERPEEPYDGRSLYDRLKEQKVAKDMEYDEAHKLKNLIRGLDDDEVQFLELVDKNKIDAERRQKLEEEKELNEYRSRVATLQEETADKKIQNEIKQAKIKSTALGTTARPSQKSLLIMGIKRKNGEIATGNTSSAEKVFIKESTIAPTPSNAPKRMQTPPLDSISTDEYDRGALKCIAILPGIGPYTESSDSELSSGSDDEPETSLGKYDLVGRLRQKKMCKGDD